MEGYIYGEILAESLLGPFEKLGIVGFDGAI